MPRSSRGGSLRVVGVSARHGDLVYVSEGESADFTQLRLGDQRLAEARPKLVIVHMNYSEKGRRQFGVTLFRVRRVPMKIIR